MVEGGAMLHSKMASTIQWSICSWW